MLMLLLIIIVSVIAVLFWINKEGNEPLKDLKGRTVFITGCEYVKQLIIIKHSLFMSLLES